MLLRRHKKTVSELQQVEVKPAGNGEKIKKNKTDELNTSVDNSKKAGKSKVKK